MTVYERVFFNTSLEPLLNPLQRCLRMYQFLLDESLLDTSLCLMVAELPID